jgi:hypothetical protein
MLSTVEVQVVVVDEVGTAAETAAAQTIAQRGVQLIATAHGERLRDALKNPTLVDLFGGVHSVILGTIATVSRLLIFQNDSVLAQLVVMKCVILSRHCVYVILCTSFLRVI